MPIKSCKKTYNSQELYLFANIKSDHGFSKKSSLLQLPMGTVLIKFLVSISFYTVASRKFCPVGWQTLHKKWKRTKIF